MNRAERANNYLTDEFFVELLEAQLELKAAEFEAENRFKTAELMAKGMGA
jgi:hypothetical protein